MSTVETTPVSDSVADAGHPWNPVVDLRPPRAWLVEASAGTGKTHQLGTLYVRLVAEYELDVRRILAITFTNAATAELRGRVRARLRAALDDVDRHLAGDSADEFIVALCRKPGLDVQRMRARLELAIRDFDQAAISTIHGFSQRTLQELAFESKQDLELDLLADTSAILDQLVDDALAELYAVTSAEEVTQFSRAGWNRKTLMKTAKALCGATELSVQPMGLTLDGELGKLRTWLEERRRFASEWASPEAAEQLAQLQAAQPNLFGVSLTRLSGYIASVAGLLFKPKLASELLDDAKPIPLREGWFRNGVWKPKSGASLPPIETQPWWPIIAKFEAFCRQSETFFASFAPVAVFAADARQKHEAELTRRGQLTFDAMLSRLATAIAPGSTGAERVRDRLRERYDAAFIDEFQDTDDAQWTVLKETFLGADKHFFLIGDPKQAIYGFRGADVNVYLRAGRSLPAGGARSTMTDNHRSDPTTVEAMNQLWRAGARSFDVEGIDYVEVRSTKDAPRVAPAEPGLEVRWLDKRILNPNGAGQRLTSSQQRRCAEFAAEEVRAWLSGERSLVLEGDEDQPKTSRRPRPGEIGILVNGHAEAASVRIALSRRGIPSVAASKDSVFTTTAADWLATWIDAVANVGRDREARAAALTPIAGWTPRELAWSLDVAAQGTKSREEARRAGVPMGDERNWDAWTTRLARAAERWKRHGFARALDVELEALHTWPRILGFPYGERNATDLRHLIELLHTEERAQRRGPLSLATWLAARRDAAEEELAQRLESDANAVRVETIHASKGLEYPIVLLPFAWYVPQSKSNAYEPLVLRSVGPTEQVDPADRDGPRLDLRAPNDPARKDAVGTHEREEREEGLRKLYVALTRARHRTIVWWGPVGQFHTSTGKTGLGRLLMRAPDRDRFDPSDDVAFDASATKSGDGSAKKSKSAPTEPTTSPYERVVARLDALVARSSPHITWCAAMPPEPPKTWNPERDDAVILDWPTDRALPEFSGRYGVQSYSSLARGAAATDLDEKKRAALATASEEAAGANPDGLDAPAAATDGAEERDTEGGASVGVSAPKELPKPGDTLLLMAGSGTRFGTFVHEVFERVDFPTAAPHADDACDSLDALLDTLGAQHGYARDSRERTELTAALGRILRTPLGSARTGGLALRGLPEDFTLERLSRADRLDELPFDLALGAGTNYVRTKVRAAGDDALTARPGCVDPIAVYDALAAAGKGSLLEPWLDFQAQRRERKKALIGSIAGILTGSIDLAFRVGEAPKTARYFVADYKTNRIEGCEPGHFTSLWLDWKMQTSGYLLQSLLYTLALHRHLRARLDGSYSYEQNFGGALYLFVRGMVGPDTTRDGDTGHALGVHALRWPEEVIVKLDAALTPEPATPAEVTS